MNTIVDREFRTTVVEVDRKTFEIRRFVFWQTSFEAHFHVPKHLLKLVREAAVKTAKTIRRRISGKRYSKCGHNKFKNGK